MSNNINSREISCVLAKSSFDLLNFMYNTDKNLPAIRLLKKKSAACAFSYAVKHESWHLIPAISKDKGSYARARVCRKHPSMTDALFIKIMDCAPHVCSPFFLPSPCSLPLKAINTLQKILVFERHKIHYEAERKDSGQRSRGGRREGRERGTGASEKNTLYCVLWGINGGDIEKKRNDQASVSASPDSMSLGRNKSVLSHRLNTYLPHNYSLPAKSPDCLGAQCIKHICHRSPSPSPLVATAHALSLTFMTQVGKGPPPLDAQMCHGAKTMEATLCCHQIRSWISSPSLCTFVLSSTFVSRCHIS